MDCTTCPQAHDVLQCSDEDARLYVGDTSAPFVRVLFTNLGTGRRDIVAGQLDGTEVYVSPVPSLANEQVYKVELVTQEIVPIPFLPYVQEGYSIELGLDEVTCVTFRAVKAYDSAGSTYQGSDQWIVTY